MSPDPKVQMDKIETFELNPRLDAKGGQHLIDVRLILWSKRDSRFRRTSAMVRRKGKIKEWASSQNEYHPNEMGYEATDEDLTATGGLGTILDLFIDSPLFSEFCKCLPARVSNNSYDRF